MIGKTLNFSKNVKIEYSSKEYQTFLSTSYMMIDKNEVIKFVENNNNLIIVLKELPKLINQFFSTVKLSLEVATDIEEYVEENKRTLFLGICTTLDYKEAFNRKRELFKNAEFKEIMKNKEVKKLLSIGIEN